MPYVYQDTVRGAPRDALEIPAPTENVLREQFAMTFEENPIKAFQRWNELREDHKTGPLLPAETARQKLKDAGLENDLKVSDAGITQAALDTLMFRKRIEKKRQEIFARAEGGFAQGTARLGIAIATTLADPISAGLNFVPVVGQARYARWLAQSRTIAGRIGTRVTVGAAEGAAGAALAEPFIYGMRTQEQADYDAFDSLANVALGGLIGSGLHVTVGSVSDLIARRIATPEPRARIEPTIGETAPVRETVVADLRQAAETPRAVDVIERTSPEVQHAALRAAVGQAIEGRAINVEPIMQTAPIAETNAPDFRAWFAQSKAVDEAGAPLLVHMRSFQEPEKLGAGVDSLTFSARTAEAEGAPVSAYLRITNPATDMDVEAARRAVSRREILPAVANTVGLRKSAAPATSVVDVLKARGFDAIHYKGSDQWQVFSPEQIRPVIKRRPEGYRYDPKDSAAIDVEYQAAVKHADTVLKRSIEDTAEATLKAAEEEASLAVAEAQALADRLGINMADDADIAQVNEAAALAERWARAAELATVCLMRGG